MKITRSSAQGFTLIELMVVVAILGILSSIAFPAYQEYVKKGRRADAMQALSRVMQEQERHRSNNATYAGDLATLGLTGTSNDGYYNLALSGATGSGYTITATATGVQLSDTTCGTMGVVVAAGNITYTKGTDNASDTGKVCWSR